MSVGHVLMGLLSERDQYGYELKQLHDATFPAVRPLAFGQIYATLARLAGKGLVELVGTERVDGPDRRVYRLTDAGRVELARWLADADQPTDYAANPFAVKAALLLVLFGRDAAGDFLRRQRAVLVARMRELTRRRSDPGTALVEVLAADYAIAHLAADIEWMQTAAERVTDLVPTLSVNPSSQELT